MTLGGDKATIGAMGNAIGTFGPKFFKAAGMSALRPKPAGMLGFLILFTMLACGHASGDGIDARIKGILRISVQENEIVGMEDFAPKGDYPFTDINWYSASGGYITGVDGNKERFACGNVSGILYFDEEFFHRLDLQYGSFRLDIKPRETVVDLPCNEVLTAKEFSDIQANKAKLDQANCASAKPYVDLFADCITRFQAGQRLINGKWLAQAQNASAHIYGPLALSRSHGQYRYNGVYVLFDGSAPDFLYVLTPTGGECLNMLTSAPDFPANSSNYPLELVQQIDQSHEESLASAFEATGGATSDLLQKAEIVGDQSRQFPAIQSKLSNAVLDAVLKNLSDANTRSLELSEWPKLSKAVTFTAEQEVGFYKKLIEETSLSEEETRSILGRPLDPGSPPELKGEIAEWSQQMSAAEKVKGEMEQVLMDIFNKPEDVVLVQNSGRKEDLAKPISVPPEGEGIANALQDELSHTTLTCCKAGMMAYEQAWSHLKLVVRVRKSLAEGKLSEVDPMIPSLGDEAGAVASVSPGQKAVQGAVSLVLSLYKSQKAEAETLLDDAERLRALGGQTSKALQDYKDAYQLDDDPQILQKIKDLNNESLGL